MLRGADEELRSAVAREVTTIACAPGQQLIKRGMPSSGLYIVASGEAHCYIRQAGGELKFVRSIGPGEHVGELALLEPDRLTAADVFASDDAEHKTTVLLLTPAAFAGLDGRFPASDQSEPNSDTGRRIARARPRRIVRV